MGSTVQSSKRRSQNEVKGRQLVKTAKIPKRQAPMITTPVRYRRYLATFAVKSLKYRDKIASLGKAIATV